MSGWTTPPSDAVPPSPGVSPPPAVGMHQVEDEDAEAPKEMRSERSPTHRERAEQDAEADRHMSTADLRRDAERTRDRLNRDVVDLRHKFGLGHEDGDGHRTASGPFAPVRRHPVTVVVAAAGATTAALIGLKLMRDHRRTGGRGDRMRTAAKNGGKAAQRRVLDARDTIVVATSRLPERGRKGWRRMAHR
ncbi:hypothetical protein [Glycomyces tenuis]|uniref:hypothetical protein n=1 Tax=Glycomyces tenuis TaxID=58116 RepID=UPI00047AEA72|nr:hypothetical protein [Glycomyces tenuis]